MTYFEVLPDAEPQRIVRAAIARGRTGDVWYRIDDPGSIQLVSGQTGDFALSLIHI